MPQDPLYYPLQVGRAVSSVSLSFPGDDTGDNISAKNPYFCELTALYWGWKNLPCDYLGLAHYRRHFCARRVSGDIWNSVLTGEQAEQLLGSNTILLPKKRHYVIETLASHYGHTHDPAHLKKTRQVLAQQCPEYLAAYDAVLQPRSAHMFNMFLMRRDLADSYCEWLFSVLFALEKEIDMQGMTAFEARLFGRISELLLDVWIEKNNLSYKEIGYIHMEPVHWGKKILSFLKAKFGNKKYGSSF